jgi:thymidylate synthase (FAD)
MQEGPVVNLIWVTPNAQDIILECARVSAPPDQKSNSGTKLLKYLMKNKHWSPFEMADMCVEIWTTRDIAHQIIRHRSFSYQEFSQRYQDVEKIQHVAITREARLQDTKNRQNSFQTEDMEIISRWDQIQKDVWQLSSTLYQEALQMGIAKEQARAVLPEGLTQTRIYMKGSMRSWIHYCQVRTDPTAQKEHRKVAERIREILVEQLPEIKDLF